MKRIFAFVTALVLTLSLTIPAQAADSGLLDDAGLMTADQQQALLQKAQSIADTYDVGIFTITVESYRDYTSGEIEDFADALYAQIGTGEDAVLLILSMAERDYLLIAYGEQAQYAFNDEGRLYLAEHFLDDFANDDWYAGFDDYVEWCGEFLSAAANGQPYTYPDDMPAEGPGTGAVIGGILLVALVVAGIYILILNGKMKSVFKAQTAADYAGDLQLNRRSDVFTHRTVSRQKIQQAQTTTRGGGGVTVRSSGGGHGTRGKF